MYLLLSDLEDPFCERIRASLVQKGCEVSIISDLMRQPVRFIWRLDSLRSESLIIFDDGSTVSDKEIEGVLVRRSGRITHDYWDVEDVAYLDEEAHAALFSWLWSLDCPVVNRYSPECWYYPGASVLFWQRILERCGLQALDFLLTNVQEQAVDFDAEWCAKSIATPLTSATRQLLNQRDPTGENNCLPSSLPLLLAEPNSTLHRVCVVGPRIIWDRTVHSDVQLLQPAIRQCATLSGLVFMELIIACAASGVRVAAIEPYPAVQSFSEDAQAQIVASVVKLLTGALETV